jgi:ATP-binding cassette, subfamily B, bacterial
MLGSLLTYRTKLLLAAIATWAIGFCVPLLTGVVVQDIFNDLLNKSAAHVIWALFGLLAVIAIIGPVLLQLWYWAHITFESTYESLVRINLFEWLLKWHPPHPSIAKLIGHVRDDVPGYTDVINEWYRLSGEGLFVLIALIVMIRIDVVVTALTFLPLAAVVLFTHWMRTRLPSVWAQGRQATTAVTTVVADLFGGVLAIKAAGAEHAAIGRLAAVDRERRQAEIKVAVATARIASLTDAISVLGQGLVLLIAARAMIEHQFSVGDFVLFALYLNWMMLFPRRMGRLLTQRRESGQALVRLVEAMPGTSPATLTRHRPGQLFERHPPVAPQEPGGFERLDVIGLSYLYPGTSQGIQGVNLHLPRGSVTVITGEIGSGKTTLLEVLLGLYPADEGEVRWNGTKIGALAEWMVPPRVAYKPQLPRLFSGTLRENITLGLPENPEQLEWALEQAALLGDIDGLMAGLDTLVGRHGVRLSGGQNQRASAARMFFRRSELLVVDDLSSALDAETEQVVWDRIDAARSAGTGTTYLMVSHRPVALRRADQIVVLRRGAVQACGSITELDKSLPAIQQMLSSST